MWLLGRDRSFHDLQEQFAAGRDINGLDNLKIGGVCRELRIMVMEELLSIDAPGHVIELSPGESLQEEAGRPVR